MSTRRGGDQHAYPIVTVDDRWAAGPEQMGSKPKFWCLPDGQEALRLFKFPQAGTGQHWAEKIAAEVAACLGILHAAVDLGVCAAGVLRIGSGCVPCPPNIRVGA